MQKAVNKAFEVLSADPYHGIRIKPLSGELQGYYRYRINDYRLIYRVDDSIVTIYAVGFGPRGDIYK
ncbi:type II toxin-antitoxin system RelE/ParE family toxin [Sporomusa sphaeroides]|uniref:type II toxin-antitoxin system RelE family toxin n=1 Tax=Sporomusa sphaeroides TaxID=47679 RepID=UPI0030D32F39